MKEEGCCFEQSYCNCHCYYIYNIIKQCNNVFVFYNLSLLLQIHQFTFNIIFILNSLLCGTKLKLQVFYTSIWGGGGLLRLQSVLYLQLSWWGLPTSYCINTFIRNTKRSFRDFPCLPCLWCQSVLYLGFLW